ncbi:BRCT domain-containing protein [uncultured Gimesia sp.]|jgi:NAD-dependent DNA ligase|uniref:BRCT domain-containing protein n=1 Tax=uncultured Gimesia sp. TaxID=1678688 RepID=UPI002634E06B|nr:BRCT domain-containing protein [uncultured Gimesia sp.]
MNQDAHGQPLNRTFNAARLDDRKIDELIGLCKGVLADGEVSQFEVEYLQNWLRNNIEISGHWPANVLYQRIEAMLADNVLDVEEQKDLLQTLMDLTGEPSIHESVTSMSTSLPLTIPDPEIDFEGRIFCLTGKFVTGTRKQCESLVLERNGSLKSSPTRDTNFLVIGLVGSSDWIHSTHGRKIEKAVELQESGTNLAIVSEEHWVRFIV